MAVPTVPVWLPGFVTVTVLPEEPEMAHVNDTEPEAPVASVADTVTVLLTAAVGVPEIRPVEELIDRPAGSPEALYVRVCPDAESLAWICRLAAVPTIP